MLSWTHDRLLDFLMNATDWARARKRKFIQGKCLALLASQEEFSEKKEIKLEVISAQICSNYGNFFNYLLVHIAFDVEEARRNFQSELIKFMLDSASAR